MLSADLNLPPITLLSSDFEKINALISNASSRESAEVLEYLERELGRADIVEHKDLPSNIVTMHSTVVYSGSESENNRTIKLVYPHEANIDEGKISILTPIGAALIGMHTDEKITWHTPRREERILHVINVMQSDA